MCELFGVNSKNKIDITYYLREFYKHSETHNCGWGFARFFGNDVAIEKEPIEANVSHYLQHRMSRPIVADNAIAHIRLATVGSLSYPNTHPFVLYDNMQRLWTLAHNGTIFDYPLLNNYKSEAEGNTDSELVLIYIVKCINKTQSKLKRLLSFEERFKLIDKLLQKMSVGNKLNLLIWDSEVLYVHYNYANTLYIANLNNDAKLFSTTPLIDEKLWSKVEFCRLMAYKNGQQVAISSNKTTEYTCVEHNWEYKNYDYSYL